MKVLTVVGARPQFVKAAWVNHIMRTEYDSPPFKEILVHTGQHYDANMSEVFFKELGIPQPAENLNVGSGSPGVQLGAILAGLEKLLPEYQPNAVLAYGDTNSTLAAALIAAHHDLPFIHVEAGERIFRRTQVPEEINRILSDNVAGLCLSATRTGTDYLLSEGFAAERVKMVGDPMYDIFQWGRSRLDELNAASCADFGLEPEGYHLSTIHRAENTADIETLTDLLGALDKSDLPVLLPAHPRISAMLDKADWTPQGSLHIVAPLGYFDFMSVLLDCKRVITDSGGVTREAFFAGKPCVIPMDNSWWTEVVEAGWVREVGSDRDTLLEAINDFSPDNARPDQIFGSGDSGKLIIEHTLHLLENPVKDGPWHQHGRYQGIPPAAASVFTYARYGEFIDALKDAGYSFKGFGEAIDASSPTVLMRHDIDFSIDAAFELAKKEAEMGIRSTYFFLVRSALYNIFGAKDSQKVEQILALGHHLGLHFDCAAYVGLDSDDQIAIACDREATMLDEWFGRSVNVVSFHRPNAQVLNGAPALSAPRPHTYMKAFTEEIKYFSDSAGKWGHGHPLESQEFKDRKHLQILVHPVWWQDSPTSPYRVLRRYVTDKKVALERTIAENCKVYRVGPYRDIGDT